MEIDNLICSRYYSVGELEIPKVIFEDRDIVRAITYWCGNRRKTLLIFSKILAGLGFKSSDVIILNNLEIDGCKVVFNYCLNGINSLDNKITLKFDSLFCNNTLTVSNEVEELTCSVSIINYRDICLLLKKYHKKLGNNCLYTRTFGSDFTNIKLFLDNIKVELDLGKKIVNEDNRHMLVYDEKGLEKYLEDLTLPIDIVSLYKMICIYLEDINMYSNFSLAISSCSNNEDKSKITDMISLVNGNLSKFIMTKGDKRISLNQDGSWLYELIDDDMLVNFSMEYQNGKMKCEVSSESDEMLEYYISSLLDYDKSVAKSEVDDVKRLVKEKIEHK